MNYKYNIFRYDLTNRLNGILEVTGGFVYVKDATNPTTTITIRPDEISNDPLVFKKYSGLIVDFKRLHLSAHAQPNNSIELFVSNNYNDINIFEKTEAYGSTPRIFNTMIHMSNKEFNQPLGIVKKFLIKARGGDFRICFTAGESGSNFIQLLNGQSYFEDLINQNITLFFQSPTTGTILEIITWA